MSTDVIEVCVYAGHPRHSLPDGAKIHRVTPGCPRGVIIGGRWWWLPIGTIVDSTGHVLTPSGWRAYRWSGDEAGATAPIPTGSLVVTALAGSNRPPPPSCRLVPPPPPREGVRWPDLDDVRVSPAHTAHMPRAGRRR